MDFIKSAFYDDVDVSCPLPEYPRPQLMREHWQNLNGEFEYTLTDSLEKIPASFIGKIRVPFAYESQLSGVCNTLLPEERLWYKKVFTIDESIKNDRILLHFGAVDWQCRIFVNEKLAGEHTGGYVPFTLDITSLLQEGENVLHVGVYDPTDDGWQQRGKQSLYSHGFWYTATSGIWQTVWLEGVSKCAIEKLELTPDIDLDCIGIKTVVSAEADRIVATVLDGEKVLATKEIGGDDSVPLPRYTCWSPEEPKLYDLLLEVYADGKLTDSIVSYFGMRKFSIATKDGLPRLCLNNKPYFQNGLLDQGYWCDGGLTPPTDAAMIYDIAKMKELGFNMLRKHIKMEPARWYYHCARLGMLVWQDMISGGKYIGDFRAGFLPNLNIPLKDNDYKHFSREKEEWRENFRTELFEMIDALYNSVSICCWVPFNEAWGQFDAYEIGHAVKKRDPSRFVDHASGWYDQGGIDFKSMHKYILPVYMPKTGGRPFVLSEFGGYSRIIENHVWNRAKSFGYVMFSSEKSLSAGFKRLYEKQVLPLLKKGLCACVYTQVSDVEFEVNGILTYDRKLVKLDEAIVKAVNAKMKY